MRQYFHKQSQSVEFMTLLGAAFIVSYLPLIHIPFSWIMTFFHEISHGIAALLTGGSIEKIELHLRGSGLCYTRGGVRFLILHAGYIGAVLWGIILYRMAGGIKPKRTNILALSFAALIALSAIFYSRDVITWVIMLILLALSLSILKLKNATLMRWALKFIGLYVLLDGIRAPLHLIDGRHYGDAASLADLTLVPEMVWVGIWFATGLIGVFYLWKSNRRTL